MKSLGFGSPYGGTEYGKRDALSALCCASFTQPLSLKLTGLAVRELARGR